MKKFQIIAAFLLILVSSLQAEPQEVFSRTFMITRPAWYNIAMDQALWHNFVYAKEGPAYAAMQLIGYYQPSRPSDKVARYFLINRKNELLVSGDANTNLLLERDIRAEWVNLPSDFKGKLSICPAQKQIGFTVMYNQDLRTIFDAGPFKEWAIGIEMPVLLVENNLNFCQYDMSSSLTETDTVQNIFQAFNQCDWNYAKLPTKKQEIIRPSHIRLTAGRSMMHEDHFQLASRMHLDIPIANKPDPEFIFSPAANIDRHVAFGGAVYMQILLNRNPTPRCAWLFYANLDGTFFFRNRQYRTYDLKDKPWSRYMQYVRKNSAAGSAMPGVNLLTLESEVRPFGFADASFGWRLDTGPFEFEIGYDLWGFGGERVRPRSDVETPFNRRKCIGGLNQFGIAGSGTITVDGQQVAATASNSTIATRASDDQEFQVIDEDDLDYCSAQAGSILNHKFHAAFGIQHMGNKANGFAGFGFFFEWPQKNSTLSTYGVWFKIGGSF